MRLAVQVESLDLKACDSDSSPQEGMFALDAFLEGVIVQREVDCTGVSGLIASESTSHFLWHVVGQKLIHSDLHGRVFNCEDHWNRCDFRG